MVLAAAVSSGVAGDITLSIWLVVGAGGCIAVTGGRPLRRYPLGSTQAQEAMAPVRSGRVVVWIALACPASVVAVLMVLLGGFWVAEFPERSGLTRGDQATVLVWGVGLILLKVESSFRAGLDAPALEVPGPPPEG